MNKSWILYGPQSSGKTRFANRIKRSLNLKYVVDGWNGEQRHFRKSHDTLYITNELPYWAKNNRRVIHIDNALSKIKMSL